MLRKPLIAIILDENTSAGGDRYDISKHYFQAISRAGGLPYGIPYVPEMVAQVVDTFDGFVSVGGRVNFPQHFYVSGDQSRYPQSERVAVEIALMQGFLDRDKPVLGICNGMQMLGCLHGCRMVSDVATTAGLSIAHDKQDALHAVTVAENTRTATLFGTQTFSVNSFHREAIVTVGEDVVVSARAPDGVIEAIEIPRRHFAFGLQWHPERMHQDDHPGTRIFPAFVDAATQMRA